MHLSGRMFGKLARKENSQHEKQIASRLSQPAGDDG